MFEVCRRTSPKYSAAVSAILSRNRCSVDLVLALPWIVSRCAFGMFLSSMRVVFVRDEYDSNAVWWGIQVRVGFQVSK